MPNCNWQAKVYAQCVILAAQPLFQLRVLRTPDCSIAPRFRSRLSESFERMKSQFFELATEEAARQRCPHVSKALDLLTQRYQIAVRQVGWRNHRDPELVVTVSARMPTHELKKELKLSSLCFEHDTYSFYCSEHEVAVWSGV
jgi:hypothetical protein